MYENFEKLMVQLLQVVLGLPIGPMKPYLDAGFTETNTAEIRSAEYGLRNTLGKEVLKEHEKVLKKGRPPLGNRHGREVDLLQRDMHAILSTVLLGRRQVDHL